MYPNLNPKDPLLEFVFRLTELVKDPEFKPKLLKLLEALQERTLSEAKLNDARALEKFNRIRTPRSKPT